MAKNVYKTKDNILPMLEICNPTNIIIHVYEDTNIITLNIGPRDWSWDLKTGKFLGAGTSLG
jgi:hypothetical protein